MQNAFAKKGKKNYQFALLPLYRDLVVKYSLIAKYMLFPRELLLERTY